MYREEDACTLRTLERALGSPGVSTRLRAVEILAHVDCRRRREWLDDALQDHAPAVRDMARIAASWGSECPSTGWPAREECGAECAPVFATPTDGYRGSRNGASGWEYVVEVWDGEGARVGTYVAITCGEDDRHAKHIALGRATLDREAARAERFEPLGATVFIVGKRRHVRRRA